MPRRHRPLETPTPVITDPVLLDQMMEQNAEANRIEAEAEAERERLHPKVKCSCYNYIDARHLERHRRSKKHRDTIAWYNNYYIMYLNRPPNPTP